jgi:hypothetical protein
MVTAGRTLLAWEEVPARVAQLLPEAVSIKLAHLKAADAANILVNSFATWAPNSNTVCVYTLGQPTKTACDTYAAQFPTYTCTFKAIAQPDWTTEILVKQAGISGIAPTFDFAQKALGGPTPLTNAIVSGLAAGGVGYGAGMLAENLFPERYIERGKLRRTLGLLGLAGGAGLGAHNASINGRATGKGFWRGWLVPNDAIERAQAATKTAADFFPGENPMVPGSSGLFVPSVPVQQFNNAVWNDARKGMYNGFDQHTPPAFAAATTGLMTGLSTGLQSPIIRPSDVINGIASAGVGLATATTAGKVLSALAGLTPEGQSKLQDMGLWGGMMHAIVPSIFGLR